MSKIEDVVAAFPYEMAKKIASYRASKWIGLSFEIREHFEKDYDLDVSQARTVTPTVRTEAINPFAAMVPAIEATTEEGGEA
jgi:hypothetical protein